MEIVQKIIEIVIALAGAAGGGVGIYFWRENRALKKSEVKQHEIENELRQADWEHARNLELEEKIRGYCTKIDELYEKNAQLKDNVRALQAEKDKFRFLYEKMQWFRCDVNKCLKRQPPREYKDLQDDFDEAIKL